MTDLTGLLALQKNWENEARRLRQDALTLIAKAELLEVKAIDLDIELSKAAAPNAR